MPKDGNDDATMAYLNMTKQATQQTHPEGHHCRTQEQGNASLAEFAQADRMQLWQNRRAPLELPVRNEFDWQTQVQPTEHFAIGSPPLCAGRERNQNMRPMAGSGQQSFPLKRDAHMHVEDSCLVNQSTFAEFMQDTKTTLASYQHETQASLAMYQQDTQASLPTYRQDTRDSLARYQHQQDTQASLAMYQQDTQASLAVCQPETQASLAAYSEDEDGEEEESSGFQGTSMACSSTVSCGFNRDPQFYDNQRDAATWEQDSCWQQSGFNIRTDCPPNCEVCRFGGHL